jgi:hypothetical protein
MTTSTLMKTVEVAELFQVCPRTESQLKSLTEHAVEAQLFADEMERSHPATHIASTARGEALGWKHALLLMGGTMPDLDSGPATVCVSHCCGENDPHPACEAHGDAT